MPGVFEELTFRGVLLHGLARRLRNPWLLALAVGAIFGFFHVSLFRIVPTAWLGFVLAWVVLLTGSVYPAMLWHALNNAIAIVPAHQGWIAESFEPEAWWAAPAALGLALSLWIMRLSGSAADEDTEASKRGSGAGFDEGEGGRGGGYEGRYGP
jgi:membrane protease YdiL (CAAX protease family)